MDKTGFSPEGTLHGTPYTSSGSMDAREPTSKVYHPMNEIGGKLPGRKLNAPAAPLTVRKLPQSHKMNSEVQMYTIDSDDDEAKADDVNDVEVSSSSSSRVAEVQLRVKRQRAERQDTLRRKRE